MAKKHITLRIDESIHASLEEISEKTGRSISEIVRASIIYLVKQSTDEKGYIKDYERIETADRRKFYPRYNTNFESRK